MGIQSFLIGRILLVPDKFQVRSKKPSDSLGKVSVKISLMSPKKFGQA
ncbi:hypothetical protein AB3N61_08370 [Leptospira sp. WS58.C1]